MNTPTRPVSIAHLVFGLIFLGGAALWAIGAATGADAPDLALMVPIILIGAGVIGLVGVVVNARRRDAVSPETAEPLGEPVTTDTVDATRTTDTTTVNQENQS